MNGTIVFARPELMGHGDAVKVTDTMRAVQTADVAERNIHARVKNDPGYQAIQAIHGMGRTMAAIFVVEIGDVTRFRSPEALCSWAGLTPRHRESDTHVVEGSITKMGNRLVRWAALESVSGYRGGTYFRDDYLRIAATRVRNKARVAVARRLLTLVCYGLREGEIRCLKPLAA